LGTWWEHSNKTKKILPLGLWKGEGEEGVLTCLIFLKCYPPTLKFLFFSFQGEFFNKSPSRTFNSVIKSEAVSGHSRLYQNWAHAQPQVGHYAGQAHGLWAWSHAWPWGFTLHKKTIVWSSYLKLKGFEVGEPIWQEG
jgi:hypothetical protein